jgi:uncharacterized protein YukE
VQDFSYATTGLKQISETFVTAILHKTCFNGHIICIRKRKAQNFSLKLPQGFEVNTMKASLSEDLVSQTIEIGIYKIIHQEINELNVIKENLEKNIKQDASKSKFIDDLRTIQCIIDKAQKIENDSTVNINIKIKNVLVETHNTIKEIKVFQKKYSTEISLPNKIFTDIKAILNSCQEKLNSLEQKLRFFQKSVEQIQPLIKNKSHDSTKATLKNWAEAIELFAEALEECFNLFPDINLGSFEDLALILLSISSDRSYETTQKEGFRRRLRYASMFILNLVKTKRSERLKEKSAEEKAIERLEKNEDFEWIPVLEPEQDINIDKISARIKDRGYKTKLSHND